MKQLINTWYHPEGNILNNANRDYYMDNLKFVLMIFVVAGHFGLKLSHIPQIKYLTYYIYIFHMPCFIFISGYFAKNINAGGKLRVDKIMNIMLMYFLFKTGNVLLGYVFNKDISFSLFRDTSAPWYLVALFIWYLSVPLIERIKPSCLIIGSFLLGLVVGYIGSIKDIFSLSRVFVFFPFFIIGFCLSADRLQRFLDKKLRLYAVTVMIIILIFVLIYGKDLRPIVKIIYAGLPYSSYLGDMAPYGFLIRAIWYLFAIILSVSFLLLIPRCKLFFSKYGSRTMQIYMSHIWFRNALLYGGFFSALKKKPDYMSYLIFLSSIILTIILANKYLEKLYNSIIRSSLTLFQKIIK